MANALPTANDTLIGQRLGAYEIIAPFGEASGAYQGSCDADGIDLLVYTSSADELEEGEIALFEREAEEAKHLDHPGTIPAHGWGRQRGCLFLATELGEGQTLARTLETELTVDQGLDMCRQILEALRSAHQRDILHRGLCADAVRIDADGKVKVAGFGAPRAHAELYNLAPEQITGDVVGPAADLYTVGVLTYPDADWMPSLSVRVLISAHLPEPERVPGPGNVAEQRGDPATGRLRSPAHGKGAGQKARICSARVGGVRRRPPALPTHHPRGSILEAPSLPAAPLLKQVD